MWGVRVKGVWGKSTGMDGLQASRTHLTGCLAAQDALDRQVEKMALSARVGQLPCPASPLCTKSPRKKCQCRHRCRPSAGYRAGSLPTEASLATAATQHAVCRR